MNSLHLSGDLSLAAAPTYRNVQSAITHTVSSLIFKQIAGVFQLAGTDINGSAQPTPAAAMIYTSEYAGA